MKFRMLPLLLIAILPMASFAAGQPVTSEVVGTVVSVKRSFAVEIERCLQVATVNMNGFYGNFNCAVEVIPAQVGEVVANGQNSNLGRSVPLENEGSLNVTFNVYATGYSFNGYWNANKLLTLGDLRPQLEQMAKEFAPDGKVSTWVHATKFFRR